MLSVVTSSKSVLLLKSSTSMVDDINVESDVNVGTDCVIVEGSKSGGILDVDISLIFGVLDESIDDSVVDIIFRVVCSGIV
jgi:hypothetical protein